MNSLERLVKNFNNAHELGVFFTPADPPAPWLLTWFDTLFPCVLIKKSWVLGNVDAYAKFQKGNRIFNWTIIDLRIYEIQ